MYKPHLALLGAIIVITMLAAAVGWLAAGREAQAAPSDLAWGSVMSAPTHVSIQFNDSLSVAESPWYPGTIQGYDGNLLVFVNDEAP